MDCDKALGEAIDLMADGRDAEAETALEEFIRGLKAGMDATAGDAERYYWWGRSLSLLEEPEQALLRFEEALQLRPDHEGSLWETVRILLHDLDRPQGAKAILERSLLPLRPGHAPYREALAAAETLLRRRGVTPSSSSRPS